MRAGVEPERIVAGTLLLLVAAGAAMLGSTQILEALLPLSGRHGPPPLAAGLAVVGFAAALTWLSVVVLVARHAQRALAVATVLVVTLAAIVGLGGTWASLAILLLGVACTSIVALLIGGHRLAQR